METQTIDNFEIEVPEDLAPEVKPAVVAAPAPAPAVAAPATPAPPKRSARAELIKAEADRIRGTAQRTEMPVVAPPADPNRRVALKKLAKEAEDLDPVIDALLDEFDTRIVEHRRKERADETTARILRQEARARTRYADYNDKLTRAGVFDGIKQVRPGVYANQRMADEIYAADDTPEEAYKLACDLLGEAPKVAEGYAMPVWAASSAPAPAPVVPAPAPVSATPAAPAPEPLEPEPGNPAPSPARPKGIQRLPNAGAVKMSLSREDLDSMSEDNPVKFQSLMAKNPDLERWYLGG